MQTQLLSTTLTIIHREAVTENACTRALNGKLVSTDILQDDKTEIKASDTFLALKKNGPFG